MIGCEYGQPRQCGRIGNEYVIAVPAIQMIGYVGETIFTIGDLRCLKHVIPITARQFVNANWVTPVGIGKTIRAQDIVPRATVEKIGGGKRINRLKDCCGI